MSIITIDATRVDLVKGVPGNIWVVIITGDWNSAPDKDK